MRHTLKGNRIYTIYRATDIFKETFMVVAESNARARTIATQKLANRGIQINKHIAVMWNIYDKNHGITTLPIGTFIKVKG